MATAVQFSLLIDESNLWDQKHGPDWTFADAPHHLAYFNRDLVARPITFGRDLPEEERLSLATVADVNVWNARKFAGRDLLLAAAAILLPPF